MPEPTRAAIQDEPNSVFRTTAVPVERVLLPPTVREAAPRRRMATLFEPITGLPNRHALLGELAAHAPGKRRMAQNKGPVVIVIELGRLRQIRDIFGPDAELAAILTLTRRLKGLRVKGSTLARTGREEFTFLLPSGSAAKARLLAKRVEEKLSLPLSCEGHAVLPGGRVGISAWSDETESPADLLAGARLAADRSWGSRSAVFEDQVRTKAASWLCFEADLSLAAERGQLRLDYQPLISIEDGEVTGLEALLRWEHPELGSVPPDEIIPIAEQSGLILPIGDWVLRTACRQMAKWQEQFSQARQMKLSVNVSGRQVQQPDFASEVQDVLEATGLSPSCLCLELTETVAVDQPEALARLAELRRQGVQIHLDDFGSGYSNLGALSELPIDCLKLDRTLLKQVASDDRSLQVLNATIALARQLGLGITLEGIETPEQVASIRSLDCQTGQGFFYHRPMNSNGIEALLAA